MFSLYRFLNIFIMSLPDFHGIDVIVGSGGNSNDLTAKPFDQGQVFSFRVNNNDVCVSAKPQLCHVFLGKHGLSSTGKSQNKAIGILQLELIDENHIVADDILSEIMSFFVVDFLHIKRHKRRQHLRGHGAVGSDLIDTKGKRCVQTIQLLKCQRRKLAYPFSCHCPEIVCILIQLFQTVCQM